MTPEGRIKLAISHYLARRPDCFFWWQESVGQYDKKLGGFRKKKGRFQRNGVPDILVFLKVGSFPPVFVGLEVKTKTGTQTESQKKFEIDSKAFGSFYFVVRSIEDAHKSIELVKSHVMSLTPKN